MNDQPATHENLNRGEEVKAGSERSFGIVFSVVFIIIAFWPMFTTSDQEGMVRVWALVIAALFIVTALTMPRFLGPLNRLWFRFGLLLHRIVNPLVMGLLFFTTVMPTGLIMRAIGKTPLQLGFDKNADSYWIPRNPPGPEPKTMKRQF